MVRQAKVNVPKLDPRLAPKQCEEFRYVAMAEDAARLKPSQCLYVEHHIGMDFDGEVYWGGRTQLDVELEIAAGVPIKVKTLAGEPVILGDH